MPRNGFFHFKVTNLTLYKKMDCTFCSQKILIVANIFFLFDMEGIFTVYFSSSRFSYCSLVWLPAVKQCHVDTMMKPSLEEPNWFDTMGPLAGDLLQ